MASSVILRNIRALSSETMTFVKRDLFIDSGVFSNTCSDSAHIVNKEGYWAVPAFTDCHLHLLAYAISKSRLKLDGMSLDSILLKVTDAVSSRQNGMWIHGRGWEASCRKDGAFPHKQELDAVAPLNPVALFSKDGHSLWMNSLAMNQLGVTSDVVDPPGGRFERDEKGDLTGLMRESAVDQIRTRLPAVSDGEKAIRLKTAIKDLHQQGIVAVHSFGGLDEFQFLVRMSQETPLPLHVTCHLDYQDVDRAVSLGLTRGQGIHGVRLAGLKLYADGALGSRTAAVTCPYDNEPDNYGMDVMTRKELAEYATLAARKGWSVAIHAIGDRAVYHSLDALIQARKISPNLPLRIEHVQLVRPRDLNLFAKYNIAASIQPCHMISDISMVDRFWSKQTSMLYPYGSLERSGAMLVSGSDAPIDDENILRNLRYAVLRKGVNLPDSAPGWRPEESLSSLSAVSSVTDRPARLEPDGFRGAIRLEMPGDLVLFRSNPFSDAFRSIHRQEIVEVYFAGERIFQSGEQS